MSENVKRVARNGPKLVFAAGAAFALQSCTPPPYATYAITNSTGSVISLTDCNGTDHSIEPAESIELVDRRSWGIYIKCAFKSGLTLGTSDGKTWFYPANSLQRKPSTKYVYGKLPYAAVQWQDEWQSAYPLNIESDGSIFLGQYHLPADIEFTSEDFSSGRAKKLRTVEFSADQPSGFPVRPSQTN